MINNKKLAIQYMLLASFSFAIMSGFVKILSNHLPSVEIVFFRNFIGLMIILYSFTKVPINQIGGKPLLLFFRGFIGFVALLMFFYNIANISLAEAQTFSKTSPIFTAIFSYLFLKEKLTFKQNIGILIGFIGIIFIVEFDVTALSKTDFLGIFSGVFAALAYTSIRELRRFYEPRIIVLSFMIIGSFGPIILMFLANYLQTDFFDFIIAPFVMPTAIDWIYIILIGASATLSQYLMTKAYSIEKGGIVATIGYSGIVFSIFIGILLGDIFPNLSILIGIILIIFSGYLISTTNK